MGSNEIAALNLDFVVEVRGILAQARQQTYAAINVAMVEAYWQIGRRIVEEEQNGQERADYSTFLIRELSRQLTAEFGKGFSVANLKNFRKFYLTFPDLTKGYTVCSLLSWSHYRLIMRVDNPQAREYYLTEAATQGWSVRQLERNIHTLYYESPELPTRRAVFPHRCSSGSTSCDGLWFARWWRAIRSSSPGCWRFGRRGNRGGVCDPVLSVECSSLLLAVDSTPPLFVEYAVLNWDVR